VLTRGCWSSTSNKLVGLPDPSAVAGFFSSFGCHGDTSGEVKLQLRLRMWDGVPSIRSSWRWITCRWCSSWSSSTAASGVSLRPAVVFSGRRATAHLQPPNRGAVAEAGYLVKDVCAVFLRVVATSRRAYWAKWFRPWLRCVWFFGQDAGFEEKDDITVSYFFLGSFQQSSRPGCLFHFLCGPSAHCTSGSGCCSLAPARCDRAVSAYDLSQCIVS
jgi:hypothetical protein